MVYNLVDRAIELSDEKYHQKNILNVKELLINNSYPTAFIDKYIALRLQKIKYTQYYNINITDKKKYKKSLYYLTSKAHMSVFHLASKIIT